MLMNESLGPELHLFEVVYKHSKFVDVWEGKKSCQIMTRDPNTIEDELELTTADHISIASVEDLGKCDDNGELLEEQ